ncbi:MAG: DUF4249 domain-containing protein, partial [Ginsengibacter sp.]
MKNFIPKLLFLLAVVLLDFGCKIPYYPPVNGSQANYLTVEGFIRSDSETVVMLSYTRTISRWDSASRIFESGASVMVEDDHGDFYKLKEKIPGVYTLDPVSFDSTFRYRLHFFTRDGKEYASDFVPFKVAPPIDSIDWGEKLGGVEIYVSTHDPQNKSRYYRYKYMESWEFHSRYVSQYIYDSGVIRERLPEEQVHVCWKSDTLKNINIGTTENETDDVLYHQPLIFIPDHDIKFSVLYSVYVSQYAMDSSAYIFWQRIKKNTEKSGSVFDAQPVRLTGNVHCISDTSEKVIGFIGAGSVTHKRIFIQNNLFPGWNLPNDCFPILIGQGNVVEATSVGYYIGSRVGPGQYLGYYLDCANCAVRGSTQKP